MAAYNKKQKEYTMNYMREKLDEIKIRVPKGRKLEIKEFAEQKGYSMQGFIIEAIKEKIERLE